MEVHNLGKYLPEEILGYYMRDCAGHLPYTPEERMLVTSAVHHHWRENDHHPEYYTHYGALDPLASSRMSEAALVEALLDMVGHRLEVHMRPGPKVCPEQMFAIQAEDLARDLTCG